LYAAVMVCVPEVCVLVVNAALPTNSKNPAPRLSWAIHGVLLSPYGVTVNVPALAAVPPAVAIAILLVFAPEGTVAATSVSELTVKLVAFTPPKVTRVD
jgi:hypothetical protein